MANAASKQPPTVITMPDSDGDDSELSDPEDHYDTELEAAGLSRDGSVIRKTSPEPAEDDDSDGDSDGGEWDTDSLLEEALESCVAEGGDFGEGMPEYTIRIPKTGRF